MNGITIGNARLFNDDCFDVLTKLDITADAVISDPPYAAESFGGKCTDCDWDTPINLTDFWQLMESKAKPSANIVLFGNLKFAFDLIGSNKKGFRYDMAWVKNHRVGFFNANLMPLRAHELVLVFGKPGFQKTAVYNPLKTPSGRLRVNRVPTRKEGGVYPATEAYTTISDGSVHPSSVLAFNHDRGNGSQGLNWHPTQKPVSLMEWLIATFTNEGDTVLDLFMGAGSTAVAARNLNRKFIGIEKELKYFDMAIERLKAPQVNLFEDEVPYLFRSRQPDCRKAETKQENAFTGTGN